MTNQNYTTTIAIDTNLSAFHFYSMVGNNVATIAHHIKSFTGSLFNEEFFNKFKEAIKEFTQKTPSESVRKVTVILPDNAVLTDTVRIPTMRGFGQTKKMLEVTLSGLYRNYADLHIISQVADQNKQYTTYTVAAVQKRIATSIYAACAEHKLLVDTLTYASSAAVCGASLIDSALKGASFLFLDVKDIYSRFVFVANGKTVGSYTVPFGLEFLRKPKVTQEDMLFDHSLAELTVLNAKERAKAKKLTIMALAEDPSEDVSENDGAGDSLPKADEPDSEEDALDEIASEGGEAESEETVNLRPQATPKIFARKSPRKLPKFMQREIPEDEEGIAYENFRVLMKWALTLIHENGNLTELGKPKSVCVNLPQDLLNILGRVNAEVEENGIVFTRLPVAKEVAAVRENLELYGGLFPKQIVSSSKF